ncbi:MAG: HAD-IB family hydrolase [Pseudomonadota bacterium]
MTRDVTFLDHIDAAPAGPDVGAFFDFDGTIIHGYSAVAFLREQVRQGLISPKQFAKLALLLTRFGMGDMGFSAMMAAATQFLRGTNEQDYAEFSQKVYKSHIAPSIYPEAREMIEAHLEKGHTVAIISSATPYQILPAAHDLGVDIVKCTQIELEDGVFTGQVISPTCFGTGKVDAAHDIAATTPAKLASSFFYSDSTDDIELLEAIGHARPLNPSSKLQRVAEQRDWPCTTFKSRGNASVSQWARSIAATGSLATSFAAALPIYALTGSRRKAQNFSISLFADTASALIGLDLEVRGEANLWSHRPAVFIFNHQSKADVLVILQLLRRDLAGVGKREIRRIPIIGQVMELGGTVLIDRKNAQSAIAAMQPLVEVITEQGKSVAMAPEGTRSVTTRLLPFKKGAFHLAMQAGVPIVPIVIHNSIDVAPKGQFVFRPATVEVEVLKPIPTSRWTRATLDKHIARVRQKFLSALGQDEA